MDTGGRMGVRRLRIHGGRGMIGRHMRRSPAQVTNNFRERVLYGNLALPHVGNLVLEVAYASRDA